MKKDPEKAMEEVILSDGRYPLEAYAFLHECLNAAVQEAHGEDVALGQRHVTGKQICQALRKLALERWGMMAATVLGRWNIHATIDFGNMVYLLIDNDFMRKTEEDSIEDFRDVYDFQTAFAGTDDFELKE